MDVRFSELLRRYRKDNGLRQLDVAKKLGVTQQVIAKWEGGTTPYDHIVPALAKMLGMDAGDILRLTRLPAQKDDTMMAQVIRLKSQVGNLQKQMQKLEERVEELRTLLEPALPPRTEAGQRSRAGR